MMRTYLQPQNPLRSAGQHATGRPRSIRVALLAVLLLVLGGCGWFSWVPWFGDKDKGPDPMKPAELVDFNPEVRIERRWRASIGKGLGRKYLRINPVVRANRIYAADGYGVVEARDRFTGKRVWRTQISPYNEARGGMFSGIKIFDRTDPSWVSGGVGAGGGLVLLGTTDGTVVALSAADGSLVWRAYIGSEVLSQPAFGDSAVLVQTIDGRLLALEVADGSVRWSFDIQVPVLTLRGTASPMFDNGVVYAGFANGTVSAIRTENGEPIWEHRVMLPEGRSELDRIVDVDGSPLLAGSLVYAVAFQGQLKALRRADGNALWQLDHSSHLDLATGYGHVYVIDETDAIIAIDEQTAREVWRQEGLYRRKLNSPQAFGNYLVVGDDDGYLHVLAQSDGRFLGRLKLDGKGIRSAMSVTEGRTLYVLGNSGSLQAVEIEAR